MIPDRGPEALSVTTGRIRISPSASVTATDEGVILRSDLGTFQITGQDLGAFLDRMVPLLDGSRDEEAIIQALADYSRESVTAFLGLLRQRGLIEPAAMDAAPQRGPDAFFRSWLADPEEAKERLRRARVLLVGSEPWGAAAAIELSAAGVGALHAVDDRACGQVLSAEGPWTLLVAAIPPGDAARVEHVARLAHSKGVVSLWSHLAGTTLVLGPLVTPGRTACRVCAAAEGLNPLGARHLADRHASRAMARLLGHMVAMAALVEITKYTTSQLGGRLLVEDGETLESSRHTLVRLPWCPVCGA